MKNKIIENLLNDYIWKKKEVPPKFLIFESYKKWIGHGKFDIRFIADTNLPKKLKNKLIKIWKKKLKEIHKPKQKFII